MESNTLTIPRNSLEWYCHNRLTEEGVDFKYEPRSLELTPSFVSDCTFYEGHFGPDLKEKTQKVRPITYTPDFVGDGWIIETKGLRRPRFEIVYKLFKHYLHNTKTKIIFFMPRNRKQVDEAILIIKEKCMTQ